MLWPDTFNNYFHPETARPPSRCWRRPASRSSCRAARSAAAGRSTTTACSTRPSACCGEILDALRPRSAAGHADRRPGAELRGGLPRRADRTSSPTTRTPGASPSRPSCSSEFLRAASAGLRSRRSSTRKAWSTATATTRRSCGMRRRGAPADEARAGLRDARLRLLRHGRRVRLRGGRTTTSRSPSASACCCRRCAAGARDTLIVADGFSCREQIAQTTDRRALHLAEVLRMALHRRPQARRATTRSGRLTASHRRTRPALPASRCSPARVPRWPPVCSRSPAGASAIQPKRRSEGRQAGRGRDENRTDLGATRQTDLRRRAGERRRGDRPPAGLRPRAPSSAPPTSPASAAEATPRWPTSTAPTWTTSICPCRGRSKSSRCWATSPSPTAKPKVHAHAVVGLPDGSTRGGHVLEAHVWPTLEIFLVEIRRAAAPRARPRNWPGRDPSMTRLWSGLLAVYPPMPGQDYPGIHAGKPAHKDFPGSQDIHAHLVRSPAVYGRERASHHQC